MRGDVVRIERAPKGDEGSITIINCVVSVDRGMSDGHTVANAVNDDRRFLEMIEGGKCHVSASHCDAGHDCSVYQSFSLVCTPCGVNEYANGWTADGCTPCLEELIVTPDRGGCEKPKIWHSQEVFTWCAYSAFSILEWYLPV